MLFARSACFKSTFVGMFDGPIALETAPFLVVAIELTPAIAWGDGFAREMGTAGIFEDRVAPAEEGFCETRMGAAVLSGKGSGMAAVAACGAECAFVCWSESGWYLSFAGTFLRVVRFMKSIKLSPRR